MAPPPVPAHAQPLPTPLCLTDNPHVVCNPRQLHLHRWRSDPTRITMLSDEVVAAADLLDDGADAVPPPATDAPPVDVGAESD